MQTRRSARSETGSSGSLERYADAFTVVLCRTHGQPWELESIDPNEWWEMSGGRPRMNLEDKPRAGRRRHR
jgi:hypothetical protein